MYVKPTSAVKISWSFTASMSFPAALFMPATNINLLASLHQP